MRGEEYSHKLVKRVPGSGDFRPQDTRKRQYGAWKRYVGGDMLASAASSARPVPTLSTNRNVEVRARPHGQPSSSPTMK